MTESTGVQFHRDLLVLGASDVASTLQDIEHWIIDIVESAYRAHGTGQSSLPYSTFLRFQDAPQNRIIGLPGYLGGSFGLAGMKWVSSFPRNLSVGLDRASAVIVLNSADTGRPFCVLEGSIISAKRTAASAALAARVLGGGRRRPDLGLVGSGVINREVLRFLSATDGAIERVYVFDTDRQRAVAFLSEAAAVAPHCATRIAPSLDAVLRQCSLISFATTAARPHVGDLSGCQPGTLILHLSLRDIVPECLLSCDNVTDDSDHVCREETSLHLAERQAGHRRFIRCALPEILAGTAPPRGGTAPVVFSPFGLGVLDLALAKEVYQMAVRRRLGVVIPSFLPGPVLAVDDEQPVRRRSGSRPQSRRSHE